MLCRFVSRGRFIRGRAGISALRVGLGGGMQCCVVYAARAR